MLFYDALKFGINHQSSFTQADNTKQVFSFPIFASCKSLSIYKGEWNPIFFHQSSLLMVTLIFCFLRQTKRCIISKAQSKQSIIRCCVFLVFCKQSLTLRLKKNLFKSLLLNMQGSGQNLTYFQTQVLSTQELLVLVEMLSSHPQPFSSTF